MKHSIRPSILLFGLFTLIPLTSFAGKTWEERTLKNMSLREKIGQLFMVDMRPQIEKEAEHAKKFNVDILASTKEEYFTKVAELITHYHVGNIVFMFGNALEQIELVNKFQSMSKIPLLIGMDAEWGPAMRLADVIKFPYNMTLGALPDEHNSHIYSLGVTIGKQLALLGVHVNFAPVVDVNNNPNNPIINHRSFGENIDRVTQKSINYMKGMQKGGVMTCAKHFAGHGNVTKDTHHEMPFLSHSRSDLESVELVPFKYIIKNGVDAIMGAHICLPNIDPTPDLPSTFSKVVMTDILKGELDFTGLVFTDCMMMGPIKNHYDAGQAALMALKAGNDIVVMSPDIPGAIEAIEKEARVTPAVQAMIDEKVLKILRTKKEFGLNKRSMVDNTTTLNDLNTLAAKKLKADIFKKAVTLVKNENDLIPLNKKSSYAIISVGDSVDEKPFTSIIKKALNTDSYALTWKASIAEQEELLAQLNEVETVIISLHDMAQQPTKRFGLTDEILDFMSQLKNSNKKVLLTVFGNPYSLKYFGDQDAIVVGYEDEIDAQDAAAKIILGKIKPVGQLPVTASDEFKEGQYYDLLQHKVLRPLR